MWLAVLSGVLTGLAFPKFHLAFLAWVSLIPLFVALSGRRVLSGFRLGAVSGLFFYGVLLYWIPAVPRHYAGMPLWLCLAIYLALIAFLALYWGLFGALFVMARRAFPTAAFILAPFFWVGCEYLVTHLLTGFPWGLLGTSQYENMPFLQTASLAGVSGISFVLVFLQSSFVLAMTRKKRGPFFAALGLLVLAHSWGWYELKKASFDGPAKVQASVIQGNVSSDIYWDFAQPGQVREIFDQHMALTRQAASGGSGLVIWPEFTVPLCFSCGEEIYRELGAGLEEYVRSSRVTLLLGTNRNDRSSREPALPQYGHGPPPGPLPEPLFQDAPGPLWRVHALQEGLFLHRKADPRHRRDHARDRARPPYVTRGTSSLRPSVMKSSSPGSSAASSAGAPPSS